MKKTLAFVKRNAIEMLRDPIIYIFCVGFPVVLLTLFTLIGQFVAERVAMFELNNLIPGIIMFSFTFVMLTGALLVSKDRSTSFIIRLYSSPMRTVDFVAGYFIPLLVVGIVQMLVCVIVGEIIAAVCGTAFIGFGAVCLLILSSLPALIMFIALGILFGTVLNEKSAPGICSVFISAAGILGGAWMPLDTMGGFETFCKFLPFYPSVYLGRVTVGAVNTAGKVYKIGAGQWWVFVSLAVYLAASIFFALFAFAKKSRAE